MDLFSDMSIQDPKISTKTPRSMLTIRCTAKTEAYDHLMLIPNVDSPDLFLRTYCTPYNSVACDTLIDRQPLSTAPTPWSLTLLVDSNATRLGCTLYCYRSISVNGKFFQAKRTAPLAEVSLSLLELFGAIYNNNYAIVELLDPCVENEADLKTRLRMRLELDSSTTPSNSDNHRLKELVSSLVNKRTINPNHDQLPPQYVWDRITNTYMDQLRYYLRADDVRCQSSHVAFWCSALGRLPAPIFSRWMPLEVPNESYWLYLLEIAIHCFGAHGLDSIDQLETDLEHQLTSPAQLLGSTPHALRLVVHAACLFATACDYMPDMVRQEEGERFTDPHVTLAGDCEDTAKHAQVMLLLLQKNWRSLRNTLLRAIGRMLEYYYVMLSTVAVTSAAANTMRDASNNTVDELMCHTCTIMVPRHYVHNTLLASAAPAFVTKLTTNVTSTVGFEAALPVLVCEGTYVVDPLLHEPMFYETDTLVVDQVNRNRTRFRRRRIDLEKTIPALQSLLLRAESNRPSTLQNASPDRFCSFYRRVNELWLDSTEVGSIPLAVTYNGSRYGVWMQDLVEKRSSVRGVVVYEYATHDVANIQQAVLHAPPMRSLSFSRDQPIESLRTLIKQPYRAVCKQLDELCTLYAKPQHSAATATTTSVAPSVHRWALQHYTYFINHFEKVTPDIVQGLAAFLQRIDKPRSFQYSVYPLSSDGALYWIVFVIDVYDEQS
jgi:hypothetical protein